MLLSTYNYFLHYNMESETSLCGGGGGGGGRFLTDID